MLKIGDKVISSDGKVEGEVVYSTFGVSVTGWTHTEDGKKVHFQTIGEPIEEVSKHWSKKGMGK